MFFGSGAVSWRMLGRVKYIVGNDNDADIANLYLVAKDSPDALLREITEMPIHETLFKHWYKHKETDPLKRAVRFLMLSHNAIYGTNATCMKILIGSNGKKILLQNIAGFYRKIRHVQFISRDFREALKCIGKRQYNEGRDYFKIFKAQGFIYADPPYLHTSNNYANGNSANGFTEQDTIDLFDVLVESGARFAMSEFDNPFVLAEAEKRNLTVVEIGERQNLKNRRTEVLIVNYPVSKSKPVSLF